MPASGLRANDRQTECTSENLLLRLNTSRNRVVWLSTRRNCRSLNRTTAQDAMENRTRMTRTTWDSSDERPINSSTPPPKPSSDALMPVVWRRANV